MFVVVGSIIYDTCFDFSKKQKASVPNFAQTLFAFWSMAVLTLNSGN